MFTVVIVPLLLVVAVAIDFSQILVVKRQLTGGVDAAALTLGSLPTLDYATDAPHDKAEAYVRAHYNEAIGTLKGVTASRVAETINVTATAEIPMTFLRIAGYDKITITVSSQAIRKENKLEVVMVLDNSGSMGGSKLTELKGAANTLVTTLMGPDDTSETVKIGLVPFTATVNVMASGVNSDTWWLDKSHPSALNNQTITQLPASVSLFTLFTAMNTLNPSISWKGCVMARGNSYDEDDTPPDPNTPATLFTPYLWPNADDWNQYIMNSYDPTDYRPYSLYQAVTGDYIGPNYLCPAPIQPLTNVKATITSAVNAMRANGSTAIPEGLAWGWRVVSPDPPFSEGVAYTQTNTIKAIVLMTDGDNSVSGFTAYGNNFAKQAADTKLSKICSNIKAVQNSDNNEAIIIYTILFDQNSETVRTLLRDCATDKDKFFDSSTIGSLQSTFESIAIGLNQLRVSR